jgi:hypothetical protein
MKIEVQLLHRLPRSLPGRRRASIKDGRKGNKKDRKQFNFKWVF